VAEVAGAAAVVVGGGGDEEDMEKKPDLVGLPGLLTLTLSQH